jgi:hypothetical protein
MLGRTRNDVWSDARFERHVELMERLLNKQQRQQGVTVNVELMERLLNQQQRQQGVTVNDVTVNDVELMERLLNKQQRQQDVTINDDELMDHLLSKQQRQHSVTVNDVDERTRRLSEKCDDKDANKSCDVDLRLIEESNQTCDDKQIKFRLENRKSVALDSSNAKHHTCDAEIIQCRLENCKSVALVVDPKRDVIVADVSDSSDVHPLRHAAMNAIDAVAHAQVLIDNLV